jgi:predicted GIY-YIG superfamily endonuclease
MIDRPIGLIYVEECATYKDALRRERHVKPWAPAKKEALISREWYD